MVFARKDAGREKTLQCLQYAKAAYSQDALGWHAVAASECRVLLRKKNDTIEIAFRGTSNLMNVITDLTVRLVPYLAGTGHVHQGFLDAYMSLHPQILDFLQQHPGADLLITGHSLGGALATLCAADFARARQVECVTFGSPRVGDEAFGALYRSSVKRSARVVNKFDPVPRTPWREKAVQTDADLLHQALAVLLRVPQGRLTGGVYAHVCEESQVDLGPISSLKHWLALFTMLRSKGDDERKKSWRQALCPHDLEIYEATLAGGVSIDVGLLQDVGFMLDFARRNPYCASLAAGAGAALLAIKALAEARAKRSGSKPEPARADLHAGCAELRQALMDGTADEDLGKLLDALCQATATYMERGQDAGGSDVDLEPWRLLAPLLGRFLWRFEEWPGQWLVLVPSLQPFQGLALESGELLEEALAALAWNPGFEARVLIALRLLELGEQLPESACQWFRAHQPEGPDIPAAFGFESFEPAVRLVAVRELSALLRLATAEAEPALPLGAPLRSLSQLAADRDAEVKCAACGALWEAYQFLGLEKVLSLPMSEELLEAVWLAGCPQQIFRELRHLSGSRAHHALGFLRGKWPDFVEHLDLEEGFAWHVVD
ncbi:unnamed protein product [Effrenium voratum]|uniref:Fungal lipase-type domain-containing protein n=1 Tax=Effrenium voratum TaxID=2562239 RepID=A0AA36J1A8_9DINO|nr:unnamed protein product [Effrenium voratum]CAJ1459269.1 unnamed protein product [Effrenium voratum]